MLYLNDWYNARMECGAYLHCIARVRIQFWTLHAPGWSNRAKPKGTAVGSRSHVRVSFTVCIMPVMQVTCRMVTRLHYNTAYQTCCGISHIARNLYTCRSAWHWCRDTPQISDHAMLENTVYWNILIYISHRSHIQFRTRYWHWLGVSFRPWLG